MSMKSPVPLFDSLEYFEQPQCVGEGYHLEDIQQAFCFLNHYRGSLGTFNSYRREIEKFLHWCAQVARKTLKEIKREDIEAFIAFCQAPPKSWIGVKKVPRYIEVDGLRVPNPEWRPFVVPISKAAYRRGDRPAMKNFKLSQGAIKELFAILSTFYNYLLQEEYTHTNPVGLIRQKSKFIRKYQEQPKIRRLSDIQWQYVIKTAEEMAAADPELHERTLFIMSALYSMYLRISELAASTRWMPAMNHFYRDSEDNWWFTTVGKGNKQRQIAVSDAMLAALRRWRKHLRLSALPSPADQSPLLPKNRGLGPITSTTYIREIVQGCFDQAIENLKKDQLDEQAEALLEATVHWLRHTGISDDVKHRPREHVRDDAGHSSSATTDKYIDIQLRERHRSARHKPLMGPAHLSSSGSTETGK
jgi:site-specific recombinase XerD